MINGARVALLVTYVTTLAACGSDDPAIEDAATDAPVDSNLQPDAAVVDAAASDAPTDGGATEDATAGPDATAWPIHVGAFGRVNLIAADSDEAGNLYLAGNSGASIDFGDETITPSEDNPGDALIVSYDDDLQLRFARFVGAEGSADRITDLAVANDGFYISIELTRDVIIDGESLGRGNYLLAFDQRGSLRWSRQLPATSVFCRLAVDSGGDVWIGCRIAEAVDFGGGTLNDDGREALLLASFDADNVHDHSRVYTTTNRSSIVRAIAGVGANVCALVNQGGGDFGGGAIVNEIVVFCVDDNGDHVWSVGYGGDHDSLATMRSDGERIYIGTSFGRSGRVSWGGDPLMGEVTDRFLVALSVADGTEVFTSTLPAIATFAPDGQGGAYVAGPAGPENPTFNPDAPSGFIARLNATGQPMWAMRHEGLPALSAASPSGFVTVDAVSTIAAVSFDATGSIRGESERAFAHRSSPQTPTAIVGDDEGRTMVALNFQREFRVATAAQHRAIGVGVATISNEGAVEASASYDVASSAAIHAAHGTRDLVYAAGTFRSRIDLGTELSVVSGSDAFVFATNYSGEVEWARRFGLDANDEFHAIDVDDSGIIYAAGKFGDRVVTTEVPSFAIVSLNPDGSMLWERRAAGVDAAVAHGVATYQGGAYVVGQFQGEGSFGDVMFTSPSAAILAVHFQLDGTADWAFNVDAPSSATAVALDGMDNAAIAAEVTAEATLCGETIAASTILFALNPDGDCIYLAELDPNIHITSLAWTPQEGLWGVGTLNGTATLAGTPLASEGETDALVVQFDSATGEPMWAESFGGTSRDSANALHIAADGTIHLAGTFRGRAEIGVRGHSQVLSADTLGDGFIVRLDPNTL